MREIDRRPEPTDPDQQLNRQQRRAARFRPLAGKPDPHAVVEPAADEPAAQPAKVSDDTVPAAAGGDEPAATPG